MRRFIIAGTFVTPTAAEKIYGRLAAALDAEVLTLPGLGMGHTGDSADALCEMLPEFEPIDLVGHSQGGMVALDLATRYQFRVRHCVTLGAPLGGTAWSKHWAPFPSARCMARGSRYTASLRRRGVPVGLHCVAGGGDKLVIPTNTAHVSGARNYVLNDLSHTELATHGAAVELVRDILDPALIGFAA